MQSHGGATAVSGHPSIVKQKKPKSREISSRFLSPKSSTTSSSCEYGGIPSPNSTLSPLPQKPRSSNDSRKHKSLESSGFLLGLWPSSSDTASPVTSNSKEPDTLATHIGYDRFKDVSEKSYRNSVLEKQRSCTEFSRIENGKQSIAPKQSHKPIFGGSMRYTGKFRFPGKSLKPTTLIDNPIDNPNDEHVLPGRFSVDENALLSRSMYEMGLSDSDNQESESEYSHMLSGTSFETPVAGKKSPASYMAPTVSSRKHGIEVPSKFMHDLPSRSLRLSADSVLTQNPISSGSSSSPKIFTLKNAMKKANSKWAISPGWAGYLKGNAMEFPSPKPPTSPRGKRVGNILSMGIELLKGKKSSSSSPSPLGPGSGESVHQLRLLHNRLIQWRFSNAKADSVNGNAIKRAENNFICAWNGIAKLQHSVVKKNLQLQKEKLEMNLNYILQSQMKALENWGNMESEHSSAISATKDYLHCVVCKIPLVDGAKVDPQSALHTVRHTSDLAASINLTVTRFSPMVEKTVGVVVELATVVTQEKLLLEECLELYRIISALETQERSLKSSIVQLKLLQLQQHQYHHKIRLASEK